MKSQFLIAILFGGALYMMYLLYAPFILVIIIAGLLAMSTSSIQKYFEKLTNNRLLASLISSLLMAILFFAPLSYFLTTLTIYLNSIDIDSYLRLESYMKEFIQNPPKFLIFLKPYASEAIKNLSPSNFASTIVLITTKIGSFSAGFLKNSFLIIIFYFFAHHNGQAMINFLKRISQIGVEETQLLSKELSSVMSVVFYSIITTAMFEGILFGVAVSAIGYNGLLFGIMYGFASLIPVVGGIIMWLPFMIYEFANGDPQKAIFIAVYSIVVISIIADTFLKPLIIKQINNKLLKNHEAKIDELVIFFAIIAGLASFGFWGMILGPAITTFFLTILKLFEAKSEECNRT